MSKKQYRIGENFDDDPPPPAKPKAKAKAAPKPPPADPEDFDGVEKILQRLNVAQWDIVLVGDGSGSSWGKGIGWACVSFEHLTKKRRVWFGGANDGTVNMSEIMAYLQPLTYFSAQEAEKRKERGTTRAYNVHIVTDSQYCRDTGKLRSALVAKNAGLWACFNVFARHGFVLHWHWMKRESTGLNVLCDSLSRAGRLALKAQADTVAGGNLE